MIKDILREGHVEKCEGKHVVTKPNVISDLDLMISDLSYSNFSFEFNLEVTRDAKITSFVGYFDTFFDLPEKVYFSTSSDSEPTHWQQVVFYLDQPVEEGRNCERKNLLPAESQRSSIVEHQDRGFRKVFQIPFELNEAYK